MADYFQPVLVEGARVALALLPTRYLDDLAVAGADEAVRLSAGTTSPKSLSARVVTCKHSRALRRRVSPTS